MQSRSDFKKNLVFFAILLVCIGQPAFAATIYVDANGTGDYPTIQDAIDAAYDGDTILVADGTYTGEGNRDIDFKGKAITVRSENGPNNCVIDCNGTEAEHHRGFYFHSGEDANSILEGFTVIRCSAWGAGKYSGGGIYCYNSSPTIRNCNISENSAIVGGGIYCYNSNPKITNCNITGNTARRNGGGIYCEDASPLITNCTISKNSANAFMGGGGIHCYSSNPTITNCTITGNTAVFSGGGILSAASSPTLTNCKFNNNSARSSGGGMYSTMDSSPSLTNCTFSGNSANYGGGMAIYYYCSPTLTNCMFSGNSAQYYGGGMLNDDNSSPTLTNCTFVGNWATNGNALACDSSSQKYPSNFEMTNCILWNGGQEIWNNDGSTITIGYTDLQGGQAACYDPCDAIEWKPGNINTDPCFVQPGYWDANGTPDDTDDDFWVEGDYHLRLESLCINAGDPNYVAGPNETDLDGWPRVIGGRIDMGAYEFTCESPYLFFAVGYQGQFTHIDPSIGEITPIRYDLPYSLQALATSPSGICYTINYFDSPSGLYTIDPMTGDTEYLLRPKTQHPVRGMAFSPDGQLYVYVHLHPGYLGIVDIADGSYKQIGRIFGDSTQADGLDFSPDGTLYGTTGGRLYMIDLDDAEMHLVGNGEQFLHSSFSLAFAPDGLLYAIGYDFGSSYPNYKYAFVQVNPLTGARIGDPIMLSGADRGLALVPEPANTVPIADAGPNQVAYAFIDGYADVNLDGSGSYDDDGDVLDYYWSWTIDSNYYEADGVSPIIQLPVDEHLIELIVDDGIDLSEPDYCTIEVIAPLQAKLFCIPRSLNRKTSYPIRLLALISMPPGVRKADIDLTEPLIFYPGQVESQHQFAFEFGRRRHRRTCVWASFDKSECIEHLKPGFNRVNVVGKLTSGRYYDAAGYLRLVPPKWRHHWLHLIRHGRR